MFPLWFFIVLIGVICLLLYVTRTTEDNLMMMSKNRLRKFQYWIKGADNKYLVLIPMKEDLFTR